MEAGRLCPMPQHSRECVTFSYCGLHPWPSHQAWGWIPFFPRCTNRAAPVQRKPHRYRIPLCPSPGFSFDQMKSYASPASLSLPFVSPQKGIPPFHLHRPLYLSQLSITHLWPIRLSRCLPGRLSFFSSQALGVQSPLASTFLCLRDSGSLDAPTSPPCWPLL